MGRLFVIFVGVSVGCAGAAESAAEPAESPAEAAPSEAVPGSSGPPLRCAAVSEEGPGTRAVDGAHRRCVTDDECRSVRLDCSNVRCTAVNAASAASYEAPLSCEGWTGETANYDCMPRFNAERPACVQGCCVSERIIDGRATGEEACGAIAEVYTRDGCATFGPTFSVEQCLRDVADIRANGDERQLQIGLDCARTISSCRQLEYCVAQFRAG